MKLAAIYNVWDGEELLEGSIRQIREYVEEVIVVYQLISNYGEKYPKSILEVQKLFALNIIDIVEGFTPHLEWSGARNETLKRAIGLQAARLSGCTHFLFMDCDEYYDPEQFAAAKRKIEDECLDSSACRLATYYKTPCHRIAPPEEYYAPFIHKIYPDTVNGMMAYPVYADPTRRVSPHHKFHAFTPDELLMHHFSYVRKDIGRKLRNSSAKGNFGDIEKLCTNFTSVRWQEALINFGGHSLEIVPNRFNIENW